jgi:hypothetical protein
MIVTPALTKIHCIFNLHYRVIICHADGHNAVVPSGGDTHEKIVYNLAEHIRRNHRRFYESPTEGFYLNLLRSFRAEGVSTAHDLLLTINKCIELPPAVEGLPMIDGEECLQCHYCGPHTTVIHHMSATHKSAVIRQTLQQFEVDGPYVAVGKPKALQFKNLAWKSLHNSMLTLSQDNLSTNQKSESGYVIATGWVGCVEGRMVECSAMVSLDSEMGQVILSQVRDYFMHTNSTLPRENITLKRWIGSSG